MVRWGAAHTNPFTPTKSLPGPLPRKHPTRDTCAQSALTQPEGHPSQPPIDAQYGRRQQARRDGVGGHVGATMAKLIYASNVSIDGCTEDERGAFDWAAPDDDVFSFIT